MTNKTIINEDNDNYKHKIKYEHLVHNKNADGQWASNCVDFAFTKSIKHTCEADYPKKSTMCVVLNGGICEKYRECKYACCV